MKKLKSPATKYRSAVRPKHRRRRHRHLLESLDHVDEIELAENDYAITNRKHQTGGSIQYRFIILLSYFLLLVSSIEIILIPVRGRIFRRYAWNTHEPHVLSLMVLMGLSTSCGILFEVYLIFFQLKGIKNGVVNKFLFIGLGISGILALITFIYSVSQLLALRSLFGSKFLQLVTNYKNNHHEKVIMDKIQIEFQCCGHLSEEDWDYVAAKTGLGEGFIPFSCCNPSALRPCIHELSESSRDSKSAIKLTVYGRDCRSAMQEYYGFLIKFLIWSCGSHFVFQVGIFVLFYMIHKK